MKSRGSGNGAQWSDSEIAKSMFERAGFYCVVNVRPNATGTLTGSPVSAGEEFSPDGVETNCAASDCARILSRVS